MTGNVLIATVSPETPGAILALMATKSGAVNALTMIGALVAVTLAVFIWAAFFRKPRRRKHRYHHRSPLDSDTSDATENGSSDDKSSHSRRRRSKERRLNPTLAKTGGLPGIRSDGTGAPGTSD